MYFFEILTNYGNGVTRESLLYVIAFLAALVIALVCHEVAHGYVALLNGDDTAKMSGRLSFNPLKHFNLIGFCLMLFVGFGFANPVPVNPHNYKNRKLGSVTVALAGVVTNLLLAFVSALGYMLLLQYMTSLTEWSSAQYYIILFLTAFFNYMMSFNISFALFNILPLYPLDGYRLLESFVDENNSFMQFLRKYSLGIILVLVLMGSVSFLSAYSPLDIYMSKVGNWLYTLFFKFWGLLF